jgi:hypothetical protein
MRISLKGLKMNEPKIMKMDWRPLGYWPVYRDGRLEWEKDPDNDR